jgi:hypothetical protein
VSVDQARYDDFASRVDNLAGRIAPIDIRGVVHSNHATRFDCNRTVVEHAARTVHGDNRSTSDD